MQAVCDSRGMFLDIDIRRPGATSDYLCFMTSKLKQKISKEGFLYSGLSLFGDNAYVACEYMVTPFKYVGQDLFKDGFNFFQSQVRINIECALGQLVQRWSILRKAIPLNISLKKTTALVMCLCKLHNFCIKMADKNVDDNCDVDKLQISINGGISLDEIETFDGETAVSPSELLNDGHHFDNIGQNLRRQIDTRMSDDNFLPRDQLLQSVIDQDLHRPRPCQWDQK